MARPSRRGCLLAVILIGFLIYAMPALAGNAKTVAQFHQLVLKRNYEKSAAILKAAAKAGDAEAQFRLANLYRIGLGVVRDEPRARELLQRASASGHAKARRLLARFDETVTRKTDPVQRPVKGDNEIFVPPVDADNTDASGHSWITRAAARGLTRSLTALAQSPIRSASSLFAAAAAGQADSTMLLVRSGAPLNASDAMGRTALMLAAASSNPVLTTSLLSSGADMAQQDNDGRTALHYAVRSCNLKAAEALVQAITSPAMLPQNPPILHLALENCRSIALIRALIPNLDIDAADDAGRTALWLAAFMGETKIVRLLLSRHADIAQMDAEGMSPLHAAALRCKPEIVSLLLQAGADANTTARDGNSPLMLAAMSGCLVVLAHLIGSHAALDAINQQGDGALMIAVRAGNLESAKALLTAGATPHARNARRETPAMIADRLGRKDIAAILAQQ